MKKKTDFHPDYVPNRKRRPFRQRFVSKLLCLCLIGAVLPIEYYNLPVLAAQEQTDPSDLNESNLPKDANGSSETNPSGQVNSDNEDNSNNENPAQNNLPNTMNPEESSSSNNSTDTVNSEGNSSSNESTDTVNSEGNGSSNNPTDTVNPEGNGSSNNPTKDTNDLSLTDTNVNTEPDIPKNSVPKDSDGEKNSQVYSDDLLNAENSTTLYSDSPEEDEASSQANSYHLVEFYSGNNEKEGPFQANIPDPDFGTGKYPAPELKPLDDWTGFGWLPEELGDVWIGYVHAATKPGNELSMKENTKYYGVYKKIVAYKLYYPDGASSANLENYYRIVFPDKTKYEIPIFRLSTPSVPSGYTFEGWSMNEDGTGPLCYAGDELQSEEDVTLYAKCTKPVTLTLYSGQAGQSESIPLTTSNLANASYTLPAPEAMEGWTPIGWSESPSGYDVDYQIGDQVELDNDLILYGIYEKSITLTYDANGIGTAPASVSKTFYANVNNTSVSKNETLFSIAPALSDPNASFEGWNTKPDEMGDSISPGSDQMLDGDLTLYAIWYLPNSAAYHVEHYIQNAEGDGYTKLDDDTQRFRGTIDDIVTASPKVFNGFIENTTHPLRQATGTILADNSLVLRLYYDRYVVDVDFDLNGGAGENPDSQTLRQGSFLQKPADPIRPGYNFMGWYLDPEGTEGRQWDFGQTVETNTKDTTVTLYAKWIDLTAPVLGEATFSSGYKGLFHWIIQKKGVTITVPITEEGSGIRQAQYILIPEEGTEKTGDAAITSMDDAADDSVNVQRIRIRTINGQTAAQFTIDEEFKGIIAMTCTDNNGNVSPRKILTAEDGGIIVEDNAPEINFSAVSGGLTEGTASIDVSVEDDWNGNLSGGIGQISYQIDEAETILPESLFTGEILKSYTFTVDLTGAGAHTLLVTAVDNAGNENTRQITVNIQQSGIGGDTENTAPGGNSGSGSHTPENWNPGKPGIYNNFDYPASTGNDAPGITDSNLTDSLPREPRTGELTHVEIYATISMIAGFSYLLLYFTDGHNMTERKKNELVARLVRWANSGSRFRKAPALIAIFFLLAYYHSIGKYDEWEVGLWNVNGLSTR